MLFHENMNYKIMSQHGILMHSGISFVGEDVLKLDFRLWLIMMMSMVTMMVMMIMIHLF